MKDKEGCYCRDNQTVFLGNAFKRMNLSMARQQLLLQSFREVSVQIPLNVHNGEKETLHTFTGYRVQHNHARGPFKGGGAFSSGCSA